MKSYYDYLEESTNVVKSNANRNKIITILSYLLIWAFAMIEIIKKQFASFEGCELHSLSYMPDEECNNADNIEWMNDLRTEDNKEAFTQCIAFKSSFRSPKNGGGAWEANEEYTWSWWLARCEGGEWKLMTWGY